MIETVDIFDNFLVDTESDQIKSVLLSDNFPWYYSEYKVKNNREEKHNHQFVHMFYFDHSPRSQFFYLVEPIIKKLNVKSIVRIKANITSCTDNLIVYDDHVDVDFECKTAVYYVNTNNGYTKIGEEKIYSKENRLASFNSQIYHTGTSCTDQSVRCVINFNYF